MKTPGIYIEKVHRDHYRVRCIFPLGEVYISDTINILTTSGNQDSLSREIIYSVQKSLATIDKKIANRGGT